MRTLLTAMAALILAGCSQGTGGAGETESEARNAVVDTITQGSKVEAGRRAADKVRAISAEQNRQLEEVGGAE